MFLNDERNDDYTQQTTPFGINTPNSLPQSKEIDLSDVDDDELDAEETQHELDQKALEKLMWEAAKASLYAESEYHGEDKVENRIMSNKGERSFASAFIQQNISKVVTHLRDKVNELELSARDVTERTQRSLLEAVTRTTNVLDYETIALVGLSNILSGLQLGVRPAPPEHKVTRTIGHELDFEAFRGYMDQLDPKLLDYIAKKNLTDPTTRRGKRIKGFVNTIERSYDVDWVWLTEGQQLRLGNFVRCAIFDSLGCFELLPARGANGHPQYAIVLTQRGVSELTHIMEAVEKNVGNNWFMIHPPRDWSTDGTGGGWLTPQPYPRNVLVRNSMGTNVSPTAVQAVNELQKTAWEINPFIYNLLIQLLERNIEIGSFRAFNEEMYSKVDNPLIIDPEDLRYSWDDENLSEEEVRKRNMAYAITKQWEAEKDLAKQKAVSPQRVVAMAKYFLDLKFEDRKYDCFYTPWFMDNRTRCYPMIDTLNPQGSDYQKALMQYRHGSDVSDESEFDLLVSIATTYGNGIDKKSYKVRRDWAYDLREMMPTLVADPLNPTCMEFWTKADEPFQFLALCHEYVNVFIKKIWYQHRVSAGRDATCSGIQITGAMLRDTRTCKLVNVLPAGEPQDAYSDVAKEAKNLLSKDREWLLDAVEKRELNRKKRAIKWQKEFEQLMSEGKRSADQAPPAYERRSMEDTLADMPNWLQYIDRSIAKMPTMLIPYGGSFLTIYGHVKDKLEDKGAPIHPADYTIITKALIEGMGKSLPAFSAVNKWFQSLAKAALEIPRGDGEQPTIRWETPNGSLVVQEYHNPLTKSVRTYLGDATTVRSYNSLEDDTDSLNESKMRTALAANVVHSIDASIIQKAVTIVTSDPDYDPKKLPFTAVHDCIYGPSGTISTLQRAIRHAFYEAVSEDITAHIAENNLPNEQYRLLLPQLQKGRAKVTLDNILKSEYLFS